MSNMVIYPSVHLLPVPSVTLPTFYTTNSYLVGKSEVTLIDPGSSKEESIETTLSYLKGLSGARLTKIIITHRHPDHIQGASAMKDATGAEIGIYESDARFLANQPGAPPIDLTLKDGDIIDLDSLKLEVIHTPGHASGHICLYLPDEQILFSGDLIVGIGTVIISPPDGDMKAYLDSLKRLGDYDIKAICPGHGPLITDAPAKIQEYIDHRLMRERRVIESLEGGEKTVRELVKEIYTDVDPQLHSLAERSVTAHLIKLETEGKVSRHPKKKGDEYFSLILDS
ncbi:MAG: MBL fold metallo-hydrolase [Deltaproteobacteria bacterium]|nr:MAG: MBL fold metallo-hydrolase [Deltaproteobacteria bacterium]